MLFANVLWKYGFGKPLVSTLQQRQLKEMDEVDLYLQFIEQNVEMHPSFASDEGRPIQRHYLHVQVKYTFRQKDYQQ